MQLIKKLRLTNALVMASWISLASCQTEQPTITQETIIGTYTYVSEDPEVRTTDHDLNSLILQANGSYTLTEGGSTKQVTKKSGAWILVPGNPPQIQLDTDGYPIRVKNNEVRLEYDNDVGIWWSKPR